jgi:hypothetical protein
VKGLASLAPLVAVPVWLAGTMVLLLGYATQGAALDRGKLVVVQQLLVTTDRLGAATRLLAVEPARPRASGRYQANAEARRDHAALAVRVPGCMDRSSLLGCNVDLCKQAKAAASHPLAVSRITCIG